MGVSPKWVKSKRRREKKKERRTNDGDNNGQATHGARKPPGPKRDDTMSKYNGGESGESL